MGTAVFLYGICAQYVDGIPQNSSSIVYIPKHTLGLAAANMRGALQWKKQDKVFPDGKTNGRVMNAISLVVFCCLPPL